IDMSYEVFASTMAGPCLPMAMSQPLLLSPGKLACACSARAITSRQHGSTSPSIGICESGCLGNGCMIGTLVLSDPQGQARRPLLRLMATTRLPLFPLEKLSLVLLPTVILKIMYRTSGLPSTIAVTARTVGKPFCETYFCKPGCGFTRGCTIQPTALVHLRAI